MKKAVLVYKVDINNNTFDRILIGLDSSGSYYYNGNLSIFSFTTNSSKETIKSVIKMNTKPSDSIVLTIEKDDGKFESVVIR